MAIPKPKKKDYKTCEFCQIQPCMHVLKNEVEYGRFCRNYRADARKIANDRLSGGSSRAMALCADAQ